MNPFPTPRFVFDPNAPRTSPGFVLILTLAKHRRALDPLRFRSLGFFTGGRPASCLAVLIVGLSDQPTPDQLERLHRLSRRWGVAVEAVASAEAAAGFGSWLLGFHRIFHDGGEGVLPGALQLACLRQMCQDAIEAFIRQPAGRLDCHPGFPNSFPGPKTAGKEDGSMRAAAAGSKPCARNPLASWSRRSRASGL